MLGKFIFDSFPAIRQNMEEDWDDVMNNGPTVPVKVETQIWEASSSHNARNNDYPRSRGRGFWNKSESVENWRKPGDQVSENHNSFGRVRNQNSFGRGTIGQWNNDSSGRGSRGFGRGVLNDSDGFSEQGRGFGGDQRTSRNGYGRTEDDGSGDSKVISVPSNRVGRIIGKGGSKIRELQDDSGAKIDVKRDNQGEMTTVELSGSADAISKATQLINDLVNDGGDRSSRSFGGSSMSNGFNESASTFGGGRSESNRGFGRSQHDDSAESINVPSSNVGRIIGKGGSKIRELQDESGANIKVQRDSDCYGETVVEISGSAEAVSKAKDLINELISDSGDRGSRSFGGSSRSYGDSSASNGQTEATEQPRKINWGMIMKEKAANDAKKFADLPPIKKNFYIENYEVANMDPDEVEDIRQYNFNITVKNLDKSGETQVPNPVRTFEDAFEHFRDPTAAMDAVAGIAAEPFVVGNTEGGLHIVENPAGHMTLKWLIQNDKQRIKTGQKVLFSEVLLKKLPEGALKSWAACNRGCFILVCLLDLEHPEITKTVVGQLMKGVRHSLKKMTFKGAQILAQKLDDAKSSV